MWDDFEIQFRKVSRLSLELEVVYQLQLMIVKALEPDHVVGATFKVLGVTL